MTATQLALGVKFTATSSGTGSFVSAGAVTGYNSPSVLVDGGTYRYRAESADLSQWEFGTGVWTAATSTLTRATVNSSSNSGSAVNFGVAPQVGIVLFPSDMVTVASDNSVTLPGALTVPGKVQIGSPTDSVVSASNLAVDLGTGIDGTVGFEGFSPFIVVVDFTGKTVSAFTGSITGTTLTVTAKASGTIKPLDTVFDASAGITAGNYIVSQLTSTEAGGALGGKGTYQMAISQSLSSRSLTSGNTQSHSCVIDTVAYDSLGTRHNGALSVNPGFSFSHAGHMQSDVDLTGYWDGKGEIGLLGFSTGQTVAGNGSGPGAAGYDIPVATWAPVPDGFNPDYQYMPAPGLPITAASNSGGHVQLTITPQTVNGVTYNANTFTTGMYGNVAGVLGCVEANGRHTVQVVDSTHVILTDTTFANAYTSGGYLNLCFPTDLGYWDSHGAKRTWNNFSLTGDIYGGVINPTNYYRTWSQAALNQYIPGATNGGCIFDQWVPISGTLTQAFFINTSFINNALGGTTIGSASAVTVAYSLGGKTCFQITPTGGFGYVSGGGLGGTVTQATNKTTGATLNKPTGQITLASGALAAGATASFTFTNSTIANTDLMIFNHVAGGTIGAYKIDVACGSGSATIYVTNVSAGSLNETPTFRFALIKGALS